MCNVRVWSQKCANVQRIQHCCATLWRSRNQRNVGSRWLKSLTAFKLCLTEQLTTTRNNMQQGVQTDATCNFQQCCVRLQGFKRSFYLIGGFRQVQNSKFICSKYNLSLIKNYFFVIDFSVIFSFYLFCMNSHYSAIII